MFKNIVKSALCVSALSMSVYCSVLAYQTYNNNPELVSLGEIEAKAAGETHPPAKIYLHHFNCQFTVSTKAQAGFIASWLGLSVKAGMTVDLGQATQYFNEDPTNGEGPCDRGIQITCNDVINNIVTACAGNS